MIEKRIVQIDVVDQVGDGGALIGADEKFFGDGGGGELLAGGGEAELGAATVATGGGGHIVGLGAAENADEVEAVVETEDGGRRTGDGEGGPGLDSLDDARPRGHQGDSTPISGKVSEKEKPRPR